MKAFDLSGSLSNQSFSWIRYMITGKDSFSCFSWTGSLIFCQCICWLTHHFSLQLNYLVSESRQREIVDPHCEGVQGESLDTLLSIANQCVSSGPDDRPTMHRVVQILESEITTPCPSDFYDSNSEWRLNCEMKRGDIFAIIIRCFVQQNAGSTQEQKGHGICIIHPRLIYSFILQNLDNICPRCSAAIRFSLSSKWNYLFYHTICPLVSALYFLLVITLLNCIQKWLCPCYWFHLLYDIFVLHSNLFLFHFYLVPATWKYLFAQNNTTFKVHLIYFIIRRDLLKVRLTGLLLRL